MGGIVIMNTNILKPEQIALACSKAGFTGSNLVIAVAVALAETNGNALAIGDNGMSFGMFQINAHAHPDLIPGWSHNASVEQNIINCTKTAWYDPFLNAKFAFKISGGTNFRPWSVFIHEAYKTKLPLARAGVGILLTAPNSITPPAIIKPIIDRPMLHYGDSGVYVKELAVLLNKAGWNPPLKVTGYFGDVTLRAVKWFQTKVHIEVDGIVGPITWGKLLE